MKKKYNYLLIVLLLFAFAGCEDPQPPVVKVAPENYSGPPTKIKFNATGEVKTDKAELAGYQYKIAFTGEKPETLHSKSGELTYLFDKEGEYVVEVVTADSFGKVSESPGKSQIIITNPFEGVTWNFENPSLYEDQKVVFGTDSLKADKYYWYVYEPTIDSLKDADGDGYSDEPCFSVSGNNYEYPEGFALADKDYKVELEVVDQYGNSKVFTDNFSVKSKIQPLAAAQIFSEYSENNAGTKTLISVISGDQPEIYEFTPLLLSSEESLASNTEEPLSITDVQWTVYKDNQVIDRMEADSKGEILYTPGEAGDYSFVLKIKNNLEKVDSLSQPIVLTVSPNIPEISRVIIPDDAIFEGVEIDLDFEGSSTSTFKGEIVSAKWDFEGNESDLEYNISLDDNSHFWVSLFDEISREPRICKGTLVVTNSAGRESDPVEFSFPVLDNNPFAAIQISSPGLFWEDSLTITANGCSSPDGNLLSIDYSLTDSSGTPLVLESDNSYQFPAGTGSSIYYAKVSVTNINGTVDAVKEVLVEEPRLLAVYNVEAAEGSGELYAFQTVTLDASSSRDADGSAIADDCYKWEVLYKGNLYVEGRSPAFSSAKLVSTADSGQFDLKLDDSGVYEIRLSVFDSTDSESDVYSKEFVVKNNNPNNIEIIIAEAGEVVEDGITKMSYTFTAVGYSPDGSALTFDWYSDKVPEGSISPDLENVNPAVFSYQGDSHIVYVSVENSAGFSAVKSIAFVAKDYIPPQAPEVIADTPTFDVMPEISWTPESFDDAAGYRVSIDSEGPDWILGNDNNPITALSFKATESLLPDGVDQQNVIFYVQTVDSCGNWSESGSVTVVIDHKAPNAPQFTGDILVNTSFPEFSWVADDESDASGFRYKVDSAVEWTEIAETSFTSIDELEDGIHTIEIQTVDSVGNWSDSETEDITVDTEAPGKPEVVGNDNTNESRPSWSWSCSDNDAVAFRYQLNGEVEDSWIVDDGDNIYQPDFDLDTDTYILYVQSSDAAGNWSESGFKPINVDLEAPVQPEVIFPEYTNNTSPEWSWSAGDSETVGFRYQLDGEDDGSWTEVSIDTTVYSLSDVDQGSYTLYLQAFDGVGNYCDSVASKITVDTTAPAAPDVSVPELLFTTTATWSWPENSEIGAYRVQLDAQDESGWSVIGNVQSTAQVIADAGSHTLYVQAQDLAGNWSSSGFEETICGDSSLVSIVSNPPQVAAQSSLILDYGEDYPYTLSVALDGIDVTSLTQFTDKGDVVDCRKSGVYSYNWIVADSLGTAVSPEIDCDVTILPPPVPVVVNGDFEAADDGTAPAWTWRVRGYVSKGAWRDWAAWDSDNPPEYEEGDHAAVLGGVVVCNSNSNEGNFGNVNHPTDSKDGVTGKSNSAFIIQTLNTGWHDALQCWISKTIGTLTQTSIPVYKDVTYKLKGLSYANDNSDGNPPRNFLHIKGEGTLTFSEGGNVISSENTLDDNWTEHEILFTPVEDGFVTIEFEKADDTGDRDNGGSYFDDASIEVVSYPEK